MTTEPLEIWLARQRPSLRAQVSHLGGPDNPAIRPLLERQQQRDQQGHSFANELAGMHRRMREQGVAFERLTHKSERFARYTERLMDAFA